MATILGIDIGTRSVRGALIRSSLRALTVERYLEVEVSTLSPDTPHGELVHGAIRELLSLLPESPDQVVAAIDGARASLRAVALPLAAKKRLGDVLPFELEPLLPFAVDEAVIDHQEIGLRGNELVILAAAVPKAAVADTLATFEQAGVTPRELAVGAAALDGLLTFVSPSAEQATLLLHLDTGTSDLCIVRGKSCELARTLNEGAEGVLARPGMFRTALHQTLMKYRSEGGPALEKVLVMGEGASDSEVLAQISQALSVPVETVFLPSPHGTESSPAPVFGKALALAGRMIRRSKRIDARKGEYALPRGMSQLRDHALLISLCSLVVVMSYAFSVWSEYRVLSEERDALAQKLAQISEQHFAESTTSAKRARELLEGGGQRRDPLPRFDAFKALAVISAAVPESVTHDTRRLEISVEEGTQQGSFELQGQLPDLAARDVVANALEAHECIEQLERGKTSSVPGQDRKNYTLGGVLACPGTKTAQAGKRARAK